MKQLLYLFIFTFCFSSKAVFALCIFEPQATFSSGDGPFTIGTASSSQMYLSSSRLIFRSCDNRPLSRVRVNSYFIAATGNTDLTGSYPLGIASTVTISNSQADTATLDAAKAWLANNIRIRLNISESESVPGVNGGKRIANLDTAYNILPETVANAVIRVNELSMPFSLANSGNGYSSLEAKRGLTISYLNNSKPPIAVVNALHDASLTIHLGTYHVTYGSASDNDSSSELTGSTELYENFVLRFNVPTCTMADKNLNLPNISTGVLKNQPASNEHDFTITINCGVALTFENTIKATITDSYTADNKNDNGILKNNPTLLNRSNVDIQLKDAQSIPLTIGSERLFHRIAWDEPATIFSKTLKANYYRSEPSATPGYVQTQATVLLDYD